MDKIIEAAFSSHVKYGIKYGEKIQSLFFTNFLLVLKKCSFWEEDRALPYNSMKFWYFLDIP